MDALGAASQPGGNQNPQRPTASLLQAVPGTSPAGLLPNGALDISQHGAASLFFNPFAAAAAAAMAAASHQAVQSHALTQGYVTQSINSIPGSQEPPVNQQESAGFSSSQVDETQQNPPTNTPAFQKTGAQTQINPFVLQPNFAALLGGGFPSGTPQASAPAQMNHQMPATTQSASFAGQPTSNHSASAMAPPTSMPRTQAAVAAAAAHAVAAQAAATSGHLAANALYANMQTWKLDQLESHVQLLRDTNQPIPQQIALLLADARRKEEKRVAKRVANRKSACSSRARKKALVEEMTKANARLRRQAMILALLPDLVITITVDGEITFCSAQVERVLRHQVPHLVGANFADILTPPSRVRLQNLIDQLLAAEKAATMGEEAAVEQNAGDDKAQVTENEQLYSETGRELSSFGAEGAMEDQSFPMDVVKLEPNSEENSDLSTSNGGGRAAAAPPALLSTGSSQGHRGDDEASVSRTKAGCTVGASDATPVKSDVSSGSGANLSGQAQTSSDDSFSSSSDARNLRKANEALDRNVREKLASKKGASNSKCANNADAKLSSLQHRTDSSIMDKESVDATSEDSGYRESNDSMREDTFSSASEEISSSQHGSRPKPLAPACNICLIRDDLTTIWCEVTSSIRTRSLTEENGDESYAELDAELISKVASSSNVAEDVKKAPEGNDQVKELLLCLRPIRDGEEMVDESLRFVPRLAPPEPALVTDSTNGAYTSSDGGGAKYTDASSRPPKKRRILPGTSVSRISSGSLSNDSGPEPAKKRRVNEEEPEKNAVVSLMLMGNKAP